MNTGDFIFKYLDDRGFFQNFFDIVRLVNPETCVVVEFNADGGITETTDICSHLLYRNSRCENCTTHRSFMTNEVNTKIEYADGKIFFVISVPIEIDGKLLVVAELIKEVGDGNNQVSMREVSDDGIADMIKRYNNLVTTDALTGLYNRRYIDETLPVLIKTYQTKGKRLFVAIADLDDFKLINDIHGHLAGDAVLREMAKAINASLRTPHDWAARYGGEEFLICLPDVEEPVALKILERIRQNVESKTFLFQDIEIKVTISIGVSELQPDQSIDSLIHTSDKALYRAKRSGKNRTIKA